VIAFIDTSSTIIGVEINQIDARSLSNSRGDGSTPARLRACCRLPPGDDHLGARWTNMGDRERATWSYLSFHFAGSSGRLVMSGVSLRILSLEVPLMLLA
jgi:hypothetical protein